MEELMTPMRYNDGARYFDVNTTSLGTVRYADEDEPWFHSENGTDSHAVGVGDILIPFKDFSALLTVFVTAARQSSQLALQQHCDNDTTTMPQEYDSETTTPRQHHDNAATTPASSSYRDTSAARGAKKPPLTSKKMVKLHAVAVAQIRQKGWVKNLSEGVYKDFFALPSNVPQYVVDAINALGIKRPDGKAYTQETLSPVVSALKTESRPSKFKIAYTFVLGIILAVLITRGFSPSPQPTNAASQAETTAEASKTNQIFVFDSEKIKAICKAKGWQLTDFRIGLILKKSFADEAALTAEICRQYDEMKKTMQNQK